MQFQPLLLEMLGKDTEKLMIIFITIPLSTLKCKLTSNKLASVHMGREKKENTIRLWCAALVLHTITSSAITTDKMKNAGLSLSNFV